MIPRRAGGCLSGLLQLLLLDWLFDALGRRFGWGRGASCTGCGCGLLIFIIFLILFLATLFGWRIF